MQCYSKSSLKNNSFRITRQYIKELKKLSLEIAIPKTDAVIISGSSEDRRDATVIVGDTEVPISKSMRHLGFQVGKNLTFNEHIEIVCIKAKKATQFYRSLLVNVNGPSYLKRLLIIHAIMSIIFYGVNIWAHAIKLKYNQDRIRKTLRPLKISLCSAYRTVSDFALDTLSRIEPPHLLVKKKRLVMIQKDRREEIEEEILKEWKDEWNKNTENKWIKTLINDFEAWMDRTHGYTNYYLTQFFTGHGDFEQYLHKFKIKTSPLCTICNEDINDTAQHTFFDCPAYAQLRFDLEAETSYKLEPSTVVNFMLVSDCNWQIISRFVEKLLIRKKMLRNRLMQMSTRNTEEMPNGDTGDIIIT